MSKLQQIIDIFLEFTREYPFEFLSLFILICLEGLIAASAVLTIAPLADFFLDPSLQSPSRLTLVFMDLAEVIGLTFIDTLNYLKIFLESGVIHKKNVIW